MKNALRIQITIAAFFTLFLLTGFNLSGLQDDTGVDTALLSRNKSKPLKIAISKHYTNYSKWLKSIDRNIKYYDLYRMGLQDAMEILKGCDGVLLSGGPDVEPSEYGRPHEAPRCEIDLKRDTLEFLMIEKARMYGMPILGICRGEQILNVAFGGSLIVDIPEDHGMETIHQCEDSDTCFHEVTVKQGTLLHKLSGVAEGTVNTNHHQAIDELAPGFRISAVSPDGIPEAIEWDTPDGQAPPGEPFIIAIQWHPERMDRKSPLSKPLGKYFLEKAREYQESKMTELEINK